MYLPSDLGYHESPSNIWKPAIDYGIRTFQIMLGNPRTSYIHPIPQYLTPIVQDNNLSLIAHGPYVISLVSDNLRMHDSARKFLFSILDSCQQSDISHVVLHVGGLNEGQSPSSARNTLVNHFLNLFASPQFQKKPVTFCLETDPGSKNGRRIGGIRFLYPLVREFGDPHLRIAWDLEHSFANGFDLTAETAVSQLLSLCDVVHFNAIPPEVERGSHLDRHSTTNFRDSKYPESFYHNLWKLMWHSPNRLRIILERRSWEIAKPDMDLITMWMERDFFDGI